MRCRALKVRSVRTSRPYADNHIPNIEMHGSSPLKSALFGVDRRVPSGGNQLC